MDQEPPKGKATVYIIIAIILLVIIGAAVYFFMGKKPASNSTTTSTPKSSTNTISTTGSFIFDVPSLVTKDIDGVRTALGSSMIDAEGYQEPKKADATEWTNHFDKNDKELVVSFNPKTRKVIKYYMAADLLNTGVSEENKQRLLTETNTTVNASNYTVEFVLDENDSAKMKGIKITPN